MDRTTERIRQVVVKTRDRNGYSNTTLARLARVNRSDLSRFANGKLTPKLEFMEQLLTALGLTFSHVFIDTFPPSNGHTLTKAEYEHITIVRELLAADRAVVLDLAKRLRQPKRGANPR